MRNYKVIAGDTFAVIAKKVYGTEDEALRITRANPGVIEPLVKGLEIVIPDLPNTPGLITPINLTPLANEVALQIKGLRFRYWSTIRLTRSIDSVDILEFSAPFEPENEDFKTNFIPFEYAPLDISIDGDILFTGTMFNILPVLSEKGSTIAVNGYSRPGVLMDCPAPANAFPLEFNDQNISDIATTMAGYFGLGVEFTAEPGPIFERVAVKPTDKVFSFLTKLAKQRGLIIATTSEGKLLFQQAVDPGSPVARLAQGAPPLIAVDSNFNVQNYYSHITGIQPAVIGIPGEQYTVENPRLKGVVRPFTFKADDTTGADVKVAVEAKAGRMMANAVEYTVEVATWRDATGALWSPNSTLTLESPGAMIYSEYEFLIRSVEFSKDATEERAKLHLTLPGAFSGELPARLPWEL